MPPCNVSMFLLATCMRYKLNISIFQIMTICTLQRVDYIWFCLILNFEKKLTYYSALLATKIDFLLFRKKYKKIRLKN